MAADRSAAQPPASRRGTGATRRAPWSRCCSTAGRTTAISTELHRRAGPLTVVPLPGGASSLVWVENAARRRGSRARRRRIPRGGWRTAARPARDDRRQSRPARRISAERPDGGTFRGPTRGAGRRGRSRHPADRRAGPESRHARCRRAGRCRRRRARPRRRSGAPELLAATSGPAAATSLAHAGGRPAQPLADRRACCRPICCAAPGCTCVTPCGPLREVVVRQGLQPAGALPG